jgi:hypothetical protein
MKKILCLLFMHDWRYGLLGDAWNWQQDKTVVRRCHRCNKVHRRYFTHEGFWLWLLS